MSANSLANNIGYYLDIYGTAVRSKLDSTGTVVDDSTVAFAGYRYTITVT
jgi:hypothetical protein